MEESDYHLLRKGFLDSRIFWKNLFREHSLRIVQAWVKDPINRFTWWPQENDQELKDKIKEYRSAAEEKTMQSLKRHKQGGFVYKKVDGKIVPVKKENN